MPVSNARDVAAELRRRLPGLGVTSEHKLLYYCQGHHLAYLGRPLFAETLSAWDMGPVVGALWRQEKDGTVPAAREITDEAMLNTIGYVVSRYGGLSAADLKRLTHSEPPWQRADSHRMQGTSARIPSEWIRDYFASTEVDDADEPSVLLDTETVATWLGGVRSGPDSLAPVESAEEISARARLSSV